MITCGPLSGPAGRLKKEGEPTVKKMKRLMWVLCLGLTLVTSLAAEEAAKVELNSAGEKQFETLPGIGPALAKRIVDYRTENGSFKRVEELMNVKGIGEKKFLRLKDLVYLKQTSSRRSKQQ